MSNNKLMEDTNKIMQKREDLQRQATEEEKELEKMRRRQASELSETTQIKANQVEATHKLVELIKAPADDADGVRELIQKGANVCEQVNVAEGTILHACIVRQKVKSLKELLCTPNLINFTITNSTLDTPFNAIYTYSTAVYDTDRAVMMLKLLVDRLQRKTAADIVDFSVKNYQGEDFINRTVRIGLLSRVWPIIRDANLDYFQHEIVLTEKVMQTDWDNLTVTDQRRFKICGTTGKRGKYLND